MPDSAALAQLMAQVDHVANILEAYDLEPTPTFTESEQVAELYAALVAAQAHINNVVTDREADVRLKNGGRMNYSYATLGAVLSIARPALHEAGCAVMQSPIVADGKVTVATRIIHTSGQWTETRVTLTPANGVHATPQEIGSAITYARRYGVSAILGIASENDDDGAAASTQRYTNTGQPAGQVPPADPFADPNRDPALVSKEKYETILNLSHGLDDKARRELTAWREAAGIVIRVTELTDEGADQILERLAAMTVPAQLTDDLDGRTLDQEEQEVDGDDQASPDVVHDLDTLGQDEGLVGDVDADTTYED